MLHEVITLRFIVGAGAVLAGIYGHRSLIRYQTDPEAGVGDASRAGNCCSMGNLKRYAVRADYTQAQRFNRCI